MSRRVPRRLVAAALFLLVPAALLPLSPSLADSKKGRKVALLVGVREYEHSSLSDLAYTENDVEELARVLRASGYDEVVLLTTSRGKKDGKSRPTAKTIRAELKRLLEKVDKHDLVLLALAGHGLQYRVEVDGREKDEGFFCPEDAKPRDSKDMKQLSQTLLGLNELFKELDESGAGVKLMLVDACRNDPKLGRNMETDSLPRPPRGTAALFSCKSGERAWESKKLGKGHGVFFHYVIQALRGRAKNDRGDIVWSRLSEYVTEKVSDEVPYLIGDGARQTPQEIKNIVGKSPVLLQTPREVVTSEGDMVRLPGGTFLMGSPKDEPDREEAETRHEVTISTPFYMAKYPVTVAQFRAFVRDSGYRTDAEKSDGGGWGFDPSEQVGQSRRKKFSWAETGWARTEQHPVVNVSYNDALAYCAWRSKKEGKTYRLPTEAEWEYACRAGTSTRFWCGEEPSSLKGNANIADEALKGKLHNGYRNWGFVGWDDGYAFTSPVGKFKPNKWGLYDMHGNVWQWVADWYGWYERDGVVDPKGPRTGKARVLRGGCWYHIPKWCRSAKRFAGDPNMYQNDIGFRVVREVD